MRTTDWHLKTSLLHLWAMQKGRQPELDYLRLSYTRQQSALRRKRTYSTQTDVQTGTLWYCGWNQSTPVFIGTQTQPKQVLCSLWWRYKTWINSICFSYEATTVIQFSSIPWHKRARKRTNCLGCREAAPPKSSRGCSLKLFTFRPHLFPHSGLIYHSLHVICSRDGYKLQVS